MDKELLEIKKNLTYNKNSYLKTLEDFAAGKAIIDQANKEMQEVINNVTLDWKPCLRTMEFIYKRAVKKSIEDYENHQKKWRRKKSQNTAS